MVGAAAKVEKDRPLINKQAKTGLTKHRVDIEKSNGQMLCTGVGSGGDFLDVFLNSILEHDSLDDLG